MSDQHLIESVRRGSLSHFTHLVTRYEKKLLSYLNKRCQNHATADDVFQETLIATYRNIHQYTPPQPFGSWLFGIARNKSIDHFRRLKKTFTTRDDQAVEEPCHPNTPATSLASSDTLNHLWQEISRLLSEEQFHIFWLRYQQDHSVKEIANTLKKSQSNIKVQLFRARQTLSQSPLLTRLLQPAS